MHAMMVASLVATGLVEPAQALGCVFLQSAFGAYDFENLREEKDLHCIQYEMYTRSCRVCSFKKELKKKKIPIEEYTTLGEM